jgi:predicted amidohydrolase
MSFKIALGQAITSEDKNENLKKGAEMVEQASEKKADLLVLPELFMTYLKLAEPRDKFLNAAEPISGNFVHKIAAEAKRRHIHVTVGILEKPEGRKEVYNTVVLISPAGKILGKHRKVQLFDSFGYKESSRITPGSEIEPPFRTSLARIGLMTCYELRFPEIARMLALRGAQLVIVPAAWFAGPLKEEHLRIFARARALENTVFVAIACQTGRVFTGRSTVVDPFGVPICDAGEEESIIVADIDLDRINRVRTKLASLKHIKSEVYDKSYKN